MQKGKDYPFEFFFAKAKEDRENKQASQDGEDRVPSTGSASEQAHDEDGSATATDTLKLDDLAYSDEDSDEEDEDWEILKVDPDVQGKLAILSLDEQQNVGTMDTGSTSQNSAQSSVC